MHRIDDMPALARGFDLLLGGTPCRKREKRRQRRSPRAMSTNLVSMEQDREAMAQDVQMVMEDLQVAFEATIAEETESVR